jgi:hypothetical protein
MANDFIEVERKHKISRIRTRKSHSFQMLGVLKYKYSQNL